MVDKINELHECTKSFKACKVADKRATDFIHDLERLHLTDEARQVVEIKTRLADLYVKIARVEANRIASLLEKGE